MDTFKAFEYMINKRHLWENEKFLDKYLEYPLILGLIHRSQDYTLTNMTKLCDFIHHRTCCMWQNAFRMKALIDEIKEIFLILITTILLYCP